MLAELIARYREVFELYTIKFQISGLNQIALINSFRKNHIRILDLSRVNQKLMFVTVSFANKKNAINVIDSLRFRYEIVQEKSVKKVFGNVLRRSGLLIGAIFSFAIIFFARSFLWKIEISGNALLDDLSIIRQLNDFGIKVGNKINYDDDSVVEALMLLDDISAVSAKTIGTTLVINVIERAVTTPKAKSGDVVSIYDAEVVRITVNKGTASVNVGDRVSVGSKLIESVEYNTEGEPIFSVDAQGIIYGNVNFTFSEIVSLYETKIDDNPEVFTIINFCGLTFGSFPSTENNCYIKKIKSKIGFLPVYAETIYMYGLKTDKISLEELKKKTIDKAVNNLVIKAGGSPITTIASSKQITEDVYKITVHIEAEVSIGGKRIDEDT